MSEPDDGAAQSRRLDPRYSGRFEVRFETAHDAAKALNASSVNFSAGGLCVRAQREHAVGELLKLELCIESETVALDAVVAWTRGGALGLRFVNVEPSVRVRLLAVSRGLFAAP
jgi:hypothetical protein